MSEHSPLDLPSDKPLAIWDRLRVALTFKGLTPYIIGSSCCSLDVQKAGRYLTGDFEQVGEISPEQCNLLVVHGVLTASMSVEIKAIYEKMEKPTKVLGVGTCTVSGTIFETIPLEEIIPVDAFVVGCPPSAQSISSAVTNLEKKSLDDFLC